MLLFGHLFPYSIPQCDATITASFMDSGGLSIFAHIDLARIYFFSNTTIRHRVRHAPLQPHAVTISASRCRSITKLSHAAQLNAHEPANDRPTAPAWSSKVHLFTARHVCKSAVSNKAARVGAQRLIVTSNSMSNERDYRGAKRSRLIDSFPRLLCASDHATFTEVALNSGLNSQSMYPSAFFGV